tara:strand:+ start:82 stop:279 length:198 start_codon:yes stop_codon:yes gene_type:complete
MATYKFSGSIRDARDTQLWKEMLDKERFIQKEHVDHTSGDLYSNIHKTTFGNSKYGRSQSNDRTL